MMNKVPVGSTISRSYGFAFGNIVNNLGAIWIPVAILWAASFAFQGAMMKTSLDAGSNPQAALAAAPMLLLYSVVTIVLLSAQIAGLTREALGLRTGNAFLQFPFGAATWRVLGAFFLYGLVMLVIYFGMVIGGAVLGGGLGIAMMQGGSGAAGIGGAIMVIVFLLIFCALIYISTRLSFFLAPVAVGEHKVSLIRSWQLSKGNFWRIFGVMFVLFVPFVIVYCILILTMLRPFFQSFHPNMSPEELAAQQQLLIQSVNAMSSYWYITYPIGLLFALLGYSLYAGAAAFSYRAVTQSENSPDVF